MPSRISLKFVANCLSYLANGQTDKCKNITSLTGVITKSQSKQTVDQEHPVSTVWK